MNQHTQKENICSLRRRKGSMMPRSRDAHALTNGRPEPDSLPPGTMASSPDVIPNSN